MQALYIPLWSSSESEAKWKPFPDTEVGCLIYVGAAFHHVYSLPCTAQNASLFTPVLQILRSNHMPGTSPWEQISIVLCRLVRVFYQDKFRHYFHWLQEFPEAKFISSDSLCCWNIRFIVMHLQYHSLFPPLIRHRPSTYASPHLHTYAARHRTLWPVMEFSNLLASLRA